MLRQSVPLVVKQLEQASGARGRKCFASEGAGAGEREESSQAPSFASSSRAHAASTHRLAASSQQHLIARPGAQTYEHIPPPPHLCFFLLLIFLPPIHYYTSHTLHPCHPCPYTYFPKHPHTLSIYLLPRHPRLPVPDTPDRPVTRPLSDSPRPRYPYNPSRASSPPAVFTRCSTPPRLHSPPLYTSYRSTAHPSNHPSSNPGSTSNRPSRDHPSHFSKR